jgi:hypothetical protein
MLEADLLEAATYRVGQASDSDLKAVAILDFGRDQPGDLAFNLGRRRVQQFGRGCTVAIDDEIDFALPPQ